MVEELRERLVEPGREVHILAAGPRLEVRAEVEIADEQEVAHFGGARCLASSAFNIVTDLHWGSQRSLGPVRGLEHAVV